MDYFELIAQKMSEFGFFDYLFPFILILAFTYALLRQRKFLGESPVLNGVVALSLAFMVTFGFQIATGFELGTPLARFFMEASVFLIIFVIGTLIASIFYPNMLEWLPTVFQHRSVLAIMLGLAVVLFITSGLVMVFTAGWEGGGKLSTDVVLMAAGMGIFIILLIIASAVRR